jgi:Aldehyde dehydrogenase family
MAHREKVAGMVNHSRAYARVVTGGEAPGGELAAGSFYSPTLIADAEPSSEVVRDEIFGPVLCAWAFDSDEEAITWPTTSRTGVAARRRSVLGRRLGWQPRAEPARPPPCAAWRATIDITGADHVR